MKFEGLLLCSDMDGTLVNEENEIPKVNVEAIEYFRAHGGKFTVATGRMPGAVFPVVKDLKVDFPCICHNGCSIYDLGKKEYVETITLDDGAVLVAEEIMTVSDTLGVEVMNMNGTNIIRRNATTDFHIRFEKCTPNYIDKIEKVPKPWFKILFAQTPEETEAIREKFSNSTHKESYNLVKSHDFYYEVFNKNASKGAALKKICENYSVDLKNVIAIGDNENDVSMFDVAGMSAAVGNAPDSVKACADIITCTNEEGAIADLISRL